MTDATATVLGERPASGARTFRELFRPHAGNMALGLLWLAATNALSLVIPSLVNAGIAVVEGTATHGVSMPLILVALLVCAVAGAGARVLSRVTLFNVGRDVEKDLRAEVFAHLSTLSPSFYRKNATGDLMSRMTNDMTQIRLMAGFALLNILNAAIIFCATLPILFALNARIALWALLPFPLVILTAQATTRLMFRRTREQQESLGKLSTAVQENLAGQAVVRAFSREAEEETRFEAVAHVTYRAAMRLATARLGMGPVVGFLASLSVVIALYVGGQEIGQGHIGVSDLVEINTRIGMLMWPTIALGFIISVFQRGKASLARINEVLVARPDIFDGAHTKPLEGAVTARALRIEIGDGKAPALRDVDLALQPGAILGVVGKTASGKSSLLRALVRQVPLAREQLAVDGVDINDWHISSLRGVGGVAMVPEDGFLFSASLKENLAFGRPDATADEIDAAIELCDLRRDVAALAHGLDTLVGERGVTLSGGQRQRVALARAILVRPRILLLDDCLSAVDAETEAHIVAALREGKFGARPTVLVVSHRLSAVRTADEIVVMDTSPEGGHIVERGTHESLLASNGLYADLWGQELLKKALSA